jgi:hypothetical protein
VHVGQNAEGIPVTIEHVVGATEQIDCVEGLPFLSTDLPKS